jgi:hypothetical protein
MIAFEKMKANWMKDRQFRVAYARLGPEFSIIVRRLIARRGQASLSHRERAARAARG